MAMICGGNCKSCTILVTLYNFISLNKLIKGALKGYNLLCIITIWEGNL